MKKTASLIRKLLQLANGETLPASSLKGDWFEQMLAEGILVVVAHGSRKSLRVADSALFRHYIASQYDIHDLEKAYALLSEKDASRAEQVHATGNSKFVAHRSFTGFLVNSYQPIDAMLNGTSLTVLPPTGTYLFISDYQHFHIPEDVVVVGVENAENFRYIEHQKYLFTDYDKILFVSRYPQSQHKDLLQWLLAIPNRYVHFGDLDLAGIAIYQNEFFCHLGQRASFLTPKDFKERISQGNHNRYNVQFPQHKTMEAEDARIAEVLAFIHECHKGYDQEGFIKKDHS